MSDDDEIERLLREIDGSLAGGSPAPKRGEVAKQSEASGPAERGRGQGALRTGLIAGAVCGVGVSVGTLLISWLPLVPSALGTGAGAFVGAFLTGTVLSWRSR